MGNCFHLPSPFAEMQMQMQSTVKYYLWSCVNNAKCGGTISNYNNQLSITSFCLFFEKKLFSINNFFLNVKKLNICSLFNRSISGKIYFKQLEFVIDMGSVIVSQLRIFWRQCNLQISKTSERSRTS